MSLQSGRVLVSYGNQGVIETGSGESVDCRYKRSVGRPYCGDRVMIAGGIGDYRVEEILPRINVFARADHRGRKQVIAANLEQVLIVIAPEPAPSRDLVERYLVAAHSLEIQPILVVNKVELLNPDSLDDGSPLQRMPAYRELGYEVIETSCKTAPGTDALVPALRSKTSILAGQSGVGKSSLVNRLIPDLDIQTGALSRVTGKGTHTTTTTIMYELPGGGHLLDSPGVWEYGLWTLEPEELADGFIEFRPFIGHCKFNNCRHASEPGCAVQQAVEDGDIPDWRYQSYLRLLEQAA